MSASNIALMAVGLSLFVAGVVIMVVLLLASLTKSCGKSLFMYFFKHFYSFFLANAPLYGFSVYGQSNHKY